MARDRSFGPRLYSVRNFTPLRKPEPRSVNGMHATAYLNWLQYPIKLIARLSSARSCVPTKPVAASGITCPESARPEPRRAAIRIRYRDSVAILLPAPEHCGTVANSSPWRSRLSQEATT
jgi:hypothetical protein